MVVSYSQSCVIGTLNSSHKGYGIGIDTQRSYARATYKLVYAVEVYLEERELILDLLLEVPLLHEDTMNVLAPLGFL